MAQIQSGPVCGLFLAAEKDYVDKQASSVSNTGRLLTGVAYECFRAHSEDTLVVAMVKQVW